jgi:4-amino-4-deoxy-L-arabinose transferase-like glycosyltransferase
MEAMRLPRKLLSAVSLWETNNRAHALVIGIVLLWTVWFALGSPRLWDRDEPRNARCAVEMIARHDWVVPMFNDELRTHKPIMLYWLQIASYTVFGISEFAARFGSALCGTLSVLAVYAFARRHLSAQHAIWSAMALASCLMFVVASRAATPDAVLIATTTIGILLIASAQLRQQQDRAKLLCNILGYVALGAAVLAKGPVGIVIPFVVLLAWQFLQRWQATVGSQGALKIERMPFFKTALELLRRPSGWWRWLTSCAIETVKLGWLVVRDLHLLRGIAIVLAIALPWYIWVGLRTDGRWLYGFFVEHNVQRAMSSMEGHSGGLWYYPMAILMGTFPWSLLLVPIVMWTIQNVRGRKHSPAVQLFVVWVAVTITVFSCASTKLPSYITTCYPAAALLIGGFFADWRKSAVRVGKYMSRVASAVMLLVGVGACTAIIMLSFYYSMPALVMCAPVPLLLLWPATMMYRCSYQGAEAAQATQRSVALAFGVSSIAFIGTVLGIGPSIVSGYRGDLDQLVAAARADEAALGEQQSSWLSIGTLDPSWVFYLEHPIAEIARTDGLQDQSGWQHAALAHLQKPNARLVASQSDAKQIETLWSAVQPKNTLVPIVQFTRFLNDEDLVVLRTVPSDAAVRAASVPRTPETLRR